MEKITLDEIQKDALQEVANIGASHAATALSQMINKDVKIGVPNIEIIPLGETVDCVKEYKIAVGVFLQITDEIPLYVLLLIPKESAFALSDMLLGQPGDKSKKILSEMDESALQEVSNVMMCAFFDSLAGFLGISVVPGPPAIAFDEPVAVMDYVLIKIGQVADQAVVFNIELEEEVGEKFEINMFLLPEPKSIDILLEKLGMASAKTIDIGE